MENNCGENDNRSSNLIHCIKYIHDFIVEMG